MALYFALFKKHPVWTFQCLLTQEDCPQSNSFNRQNVRVASILIRSGYVAFRFSKFEIHHTFCSPKITKGTECIICRTPLFYRRLVRWNYLLRRCDFDRPDFQATTHHNWVKFFRAEMLPMCRTHGHPKFLTLPSICSDLDGETTWWIAADIIYRQADNQWIPLATFCTMAQQWAILCLDGQ
jgi:hypothetical protein